MPALLCVKENEETPAHRKEISQDEAKVLLSRCASKFCKTEPKLKGKRRPVVPDFVGCDRYAVHLESKLGAFEAGYYLLENRPEELEALLRREKEKGR
jgi:hypothetical protein